MKINLLVVGLIICVTTKLPINTISVLPPKTVKHILKTQKQKMIQINHYSKFVFSLCFVESSNNAKAFNKKEQARGMFQIRPIMLEDVNNILGYNKYTIKDCFDVQKSYEMFTIFIIHYKTYYEKQGFKISYKDIACMWNSGPGRFRDGHSEIYWNKIKHRMLSM